MLVTSLEIAESGPDIVPLLKWNWRTMKLLTTARNSSWQRKSQFIVPLLVIAQMQSNPKADYLASSSTIQQSKTQCWTWYITTQGTSTLSTMAIGQLSQSVTHKYSRPLLIWTSLIRSLDNPNRNNILINLWCALFENKLFFINFKIWLSIGLYYSNLL